MATMTVKTDRILVDPALQPRTAGLDPDHIAALQECPDSWPPLVVVERGGYLLLDGFHRFAAAQNLGLDSLSVEVREVPEDADLRALAFALNASHGRPLTLADRRAEAQRLLSAEPQSRTLRSRGGRRSRRRPSRPCGRSLRQPTRYRLVSRG